MNEDTKKQLARQLFRGYQRIGDVIARWTRLEYTGPDHLPGGPTLVVANHGFGTIHDMNAYVLGSIARHHAPADGTPITILAHDTAWRIGLGAWAERAGFRRANRQNALEALAAGHLVVVLPGGDIDAGKPFSQRNRVLFGGRTGFAAVAMQAGVPIVPIVIAGAGETAVVLGSGERIARRLGLPGRLRVKTLPISLSVPWGLTIGFAGMVVPYVPLPAKMRASVLAPMRPLDNETETDFAARVLACMNQSMHDMTHGRLPFLGFDLPGRRDRG